MLAASSAAPMATLGNVMPGQTVEIIVQAVNEGLQSVASEPVVVMLPPVAARTAPAIPADAQSNGNGNGHANGEVLASRRDSSRVP